ncbi:MAG: TonB-dependent receptor, partial [Nitrosospira sp.]
MSRSHCNHPTTTCDSILIQLKSIKQKQPPISLIKVLHSGLFFFGVGAVIAFPHSVSAESAPSTGAPADNAIQVYDIPSGSLEMALTQFAKQAGVAISFDAAEVKGITTQELKGRFTPRAGLNRLVAGGDLEVAAQGDGYTVKKPDAAANQPPVLPAVKIVAQADTAPTDGYMARKSFGATRTDTLLRDVPQSITVITKEMIRDQTMQNMADVVRYVPGVGISQGEGNRDNLVFRGSNTSGDFYVDGLRDDVQYFRDLYNIDRVDVLKGSNGMIFGRGGSGGVINRVTKEAGWTSVNEIALQYGSFSHKRVTADLGRAINDVAAFRLNAMYEHSHTFRQGTELERGGVNPTFTFKPAARTKVVLNGEYFTDNRTADRGIPSFGTRAGVVGSGRPLDIDRSTFFGNQANSPTHVDAWASNSLIQHTFDNELTVRNRTRFASYDKFYQNVYANGVATAQDASGTVAISAYNNAMQRENLFNQTDFLYNVNTWGVKHEFMTGVEYGRQVTSNQRNSGFFNNTSTSVTVPIFNPITFAPVTFRPNATDANNHGIVDVAGIYIQDQITILPQLKAVLGLRYDNFDLNFTNNRTGDRFHVTNGLLSPRAG